MSCLCPLWCFGMMLFVTPFSCCAGSSANFVWCLVSIYHNIKAKAGSVWCARMGMFGKQCVYESDIHCKLVTILFEFKQRMNISMLPSHCEHTSVPKDELLWGHIKPRKTYYWEILRDFSSGWKEFCTLAGNQCFLILIRPVATSTIDISAPGKTSFEVPIVAATLLLRNHGIPHADGVPLVFLVLALSGCLMKGRFPCSDMLLTL